MSHRVGPMTTLIALTLAVGCSSDTGASIGGETPPENALACDSVTAGGWAENSHAKAANLQYDLVFDQSQVNRLDIVMCPEAWQTMQDDIAELLENSGRPGPGLDLVGADPVYVPVTVAFNDKTWPMVGMRYKGNSTLIQTYKRGSLKLPFRLNFDRYEDDHEEVENQRFYGFKELKFGNGALDDSLIRDITASETFRDAGIPASKGTFVRIYADIGDGPVFWGLYSMFEDPSESLLDDWFGSDKGNCYKPEGDGAYLSAFDEESFAKCTNKDEADFGDVEALIDSLGSTSTGATFRADLASRFDIDGYLAYQAMNNLQANWDVYGLAAHNYYLYADPDNGDRLTWIPWDFNMAYSRSGPRTPLSLDMEEVADNWPLIRRTMDDPTYSARYYELMQQHLDGPFQLDVQRDRMERYHTLIAPYVDGTLSEEAATFTTINSIATFEASLDGGSDSLFDNLETTMAEAQKALDSR